MNRAVFLDRDGVINADRGYVHRPQDFQIIPGVPEALAELKRAGWLLVVVTNQSGIGRGLFTEADYAAVMDHMARKLSDSGVTIDAAFRCHHKPEDGCTCRKPAPGKILEAARLLGIDLAASVMVGDRATDVAAGRAAGVGQCLLVRTGHPIDADAEALADGVFDDLMGCAERILWYDAREGSQA